MTTASPGLAPQRVRPAVRWFAIVAVVLLLPFAVHAAWDYIETRRLVRELDAIRAKGEGLTPADLGRGYRQLDDEETRAARYYMAAAVLAYQPASKDRGALRDFRAFVAGASAQPDLATVRAKLDAIVGEGSEALALLDKAAGLSFRGFPAGTEYNYRTSEMWSLRNLNATRTASLSTAGGGDAAAASAVADITLRSVNGVPFWSYVNDIPVVLSFSRPSQDALARMDAALAAAESPERAAGDLATDRALMIDQAWREYYGPDPRAPFARTLPRRTLDGWLARPWVSHTLVETLRMWREALAASRTPWPGKLRAVRDVAARYPAPLRVSRPLLGMAVRLPVAAQTSSLVLSSAIVLVADRAARVAIAVERFRRDHADALPERLDELVPNYMNAIPEDPLSGKPLLFKASNEAYTLYSVGEDGKDDGGDLVSDYVRDVQRGWGSRPLRGRDMGFRVLLSQGAGSKQQAAGSRQ